MTRSRLLPSSSPASSSGTRPRPVFALVVALGIGGAALAAGPALASQLEGGTIGAPMHGTSADAPPPRGRVDAESARQRAAAAAPSTDHRSAPRAPAAPASGPRTGH